MFSMEALSSQASCAWWSAANSHLIGRSVLSVQRWWTKRLEWPQLSAAVSPDRFFRRPPINIKAGDYFHPGDIAAARGTLSCEGRAECVSWVAMEHGSLASLRRSPTRPHFTSRPSASDAFLGHTDGKSCTCCFPHMGLSSVKTLLNVAGGDVTAARSSTLKVLTHRGQICKAFCGGEKANSLTADQSKMMMASR